MKRQNLAGLLVLCLVLAASGLAFASGGQEASWGSYDLGGRTISFVTYPDYTDEEAIELVEEMFNVKVQVIKVDSWDNPEQHMARLLSGDSEWDIWQLSHPAFFDLVSQGALYPMSSVLPEDYLDSLAPETRAKVEGLSYNGELYAFNSQLTILTEMTYFVWNKSLFEREGLPDLNEYYHNDEWTWDKVTPIAQAATRDTDGDGMIDQYGLGMLFAEDWFYANKSAAYMRDDTGRMVFGGDSEAAIATLNQLHEWQTVHQATHPAWGHPPFIAGEVAMANAWGWQLWDISSQMEDEYGILPLPRGPHADSYSYPANGIYMIFLPANSQNPEAMAAIATMLMPTVDDYYNVWFEGQVFQLARDRVSASVLQEALENWDGAFKIPATTRDTAFGDNLWQAIEGSKTPAAAMAEVKNAVQANIDTIFGQ